MYSEKAGVQLVVLGVVDGDTIEIKKMEPFERPFFVLPTFDFWNPGC